ncbi:MAG: hypothetical protein K6U87_05600 [Firmicutes bacterium]|nr:hypothetical protein [Bacillota bacterium]
MVIVNTNEDLGAALNAGYTNVVKWSQVASDPSQFAGDNIIIAGGTAAIPPSVGATLAQAGAASVVQIGGATVYQTQNMLDKYIDGTPLQDLAALANQGADVRTYWQVDNPYVGVGTTYYNETNHGVDGVSQYLPPPTPPARTGQPTQPQTVNVPPPPAPPPVNWNISVNAYLSASATVVPVGTPVTLSSSVGCGGGAYSAWACWSVESYGAPILEIAPQRQSLQLCHPADPYSPYFFQICGGPVTETTPGVYTFQSEADGSWSTPVTVVWEPTTPPGGLLSPAVAVTWDPVPTSLTLSAQPAALPVGGTTVLTAALDLALSPASGDAITIWDTTSGQVAATCTAAQLDGALTCQGTWTEGQSGPQTFQATVGPPGAAPNSPDALLTSNPVQVDWAVHVDLSMQPTAVAVGSASQATITLSVPVPGAVTDLWDATTQQLAGSCPADQATCRVSVTEGQPGQHLFFATVQAPGSGWPGWNGSGPTRPVIGNSATVSVDWLEPVTVSSAPQYAACMPNPPLTTYDGQPVQPPQGDTWVVQGGAQPNTILPGPGWAIDQVVQTTELPTTPPQVLSQKTVYQEAYDPTDCPYPLLVPLGTFGSQG